MQVTRDLLFGNVVDAYFPASNLSVFSASSVLNVLDLSGAGRMMEEKDVLIRVRDGLRMAARIYRPDGAGPFPTLFATSPYRYDNNTLPAQPMFLWRETGPIEWYVDQGYAYLHADVRGTGRSEGEFEFLGRREQHDLYDVIEWIGSQPWSNGKVGGIGQSYYAM
jgi:putative CocE/NonD family hydrolase